MKKLFFLSASILLASVLNADTGIPEFFGETFTPIPSIEVKMRDTCFANVFHSISTNGFIMTNLSGRNVTFLSRRMNNDDVFVQGADYHIEGSNILFEVGYYTTTKEITNGLDPLEHATDLYSTMERPWFQQYMDGPGNICFLPIMANVNEPTTIRDAFFCRDNVAVHVRNSLGGDVLAFIKLLDDCILASSVEEPE